MGNDFWQHIVDTMCECGHLSSEHEDIRYGFTVAKGYGKCTKCKCKKFKWAKNIMRGDENDRQKDIHR